MLLFTYVSESEFASLSPSYYALVFFTWIFYSALIDYFSNYELKQQAQVSTIALCLLWLGFRRIAKSQTANEGI
jgi:hypothetical protein